MRSSLVQVAVLEHVPLSCLIAFLVAPPADMPGWNDGFDGKAAQRELAALLLQATYVSTRNINSSIAVMRSSAAICLQDAGSLAYPSLQELLAMLLRLGSPGRIFSLSLLQTLQVTFWLQGKQHQLEHELHICLVSTSISRVMGFSG
jgi:hypothetical protein